MTEVDTRTTLSRLQTLQIRPQKITPSLTLMVDRAVRGAAVAALALFVSIGAVLSTRPLLVVAGCLVVAVGTVAVLLVRSADGWPLTAGIAVVALVVVVLGNGSSANLAWFALCVLAGWCALKAGTVQAVVLVACMMALLAWQWTLMSDETGWGAWIAGTIFTLVVCVPARRQSELVDELREAQSGLADRARVEERNRIAREIHDVIGHSLTVSLLHVSSARLAVQEEPADALVALEEAERLGRQSLAEVRQVVGLMRDDDGPGLTPMPGADQIEALVESVRRAGTPVELKVVGSTASLTATRGLTAYRILQEALTNVARHAPGAATVVRVEVGATETRLTVDSAGAPGVERPGALGILSMRERSEALGGQLKAGPGGSGWRVEAVLPT